MAFTIFWSLLWAILLILSIRQVLTRPPDRAKLAVWFKTSSMMLGVLGTIIGATFFLMDYSASAIPSNQQLMHDIGICVVTSLEGWIGTLVMSALFVMRSKSQDEHIRASIDLMEDLEKVTGLVAHNMERAESSGDRMGRLNSVRTLLGDLNEGLKLVGQRVGVLSKINEHLTGIGEKRAAAETLELAGQGTAALAQVDSEQLALVFSELERLDGIDSTGLTDVNTQLQLAVDVLAALTGEDASNGMKVLDAYYRYIAAFAGLDAESIDAVFTQLDRLGNVDAAGLTDVNTQLQLAVDVLAALIGADVSKGVSALGTIKDSAAQFESLDAAKMERGLKALEGIATAVGSLDIPEGTIASLGELDMAVGGLASHGPGVAAVSDSLRFLPARLSTLAAKIRSNPKLMEALGLVKQVSVELDGE